MKNLFWSIAFLLFLITTANNPAVAGDNSDHIKADFHIDVPANQIDVHLEYEMYLAENTESLHFFLSKQVSEFACILRKHDKATFSLEEDPNSMLAGMVKDLVINLNEPIQANQSVSIEMDYTLDGMITDDSWIELYVEKFWTPLEASFGKTFSYDYTLAISESYHLLSAGNQNQLKDGTFKVTCDAPMVDIPLIAAQRAEKTESKNGDITVYAPNKISYAEEALRQSAVALGFYKDSFGPSEIEQEIKVIFRPAQMQANPYARPGYIILNQDPNYLENEFHHFNLIAHETAHLWWSLAHPMQYAWLNESLAEYSAVLAIGEKYGSDKQIELLQAYSEDSKGMGPVIYGNPLGDSAVLYRKGPVILNELAASIGETEMREFLKACYRQRITTTEDFIQLLRKAHGEEAASTFNSLLEN